ncbi:hypothetical protein GCK32_020283 [Trichostrongylus colubriformis]|uniref:Uncharacterized protein n=1 Tax=Trichostrongylus colubriformis TaxID=6319 RepID=A0AAN8F6N4_TRICO
MCSFKSGAACRFKEEGEYIVHVFKENFIRKRICWFSNIHHYTVCPCDQDLCNGNFSHLTKLWMQTNIDDGNMHHCTLEYLRSSKVLSISGSNVD